MRQPLRDVFAGLNDRLQDALYRAHEARDEVSDISADIDRLYNRQDTIQGEIDNISHEIRDLTAEIEEAKQALEEIE